MYCENCGHKLIENTLYCENCGAKVNLTGSQENNAAENVHKNAAPENLADTLAGPNIITDEKGVMRWVYEFSLWKNPVILITTWKVFLFSGGFVGALLFFITLENGFVEALKLAFEIFLIAAGVCTCLLAIVYPIFCLINHGKYCAMFEMDKKGIRHTQLDSQFKKAQAVGIITALIGAAAGNLSAAGAGLISASRQSMYNRFKDIKRIKIVARRNVIYLAETLNHNQIYAENEDFKFICDYILSHCGDKVKVKIK